MQPGEHELLSRVEEHHWWYRGLRDAVVCAIRSSGEPLPLAARVLDAGCGTGENLRLLARLLEPSYLGGFDASAQAVELARAKAPEADVYLGDICDPEIRTDALDLVLSLDVIYIPGAERAMPGLRRLVERLRPGGRLILNLPAYDWLYSEHDAAIHTRERYTARRVRRLLERLDLTVELLSYRLFFLFPAVALSRLARKSRSRDPSAARSDLHRPPPAWANRALSGLLRGENALMARGVRFPWGSSVLAVGRKRSAAGRPGAGTGRVTE